MEPIIKHTRKITFEVFDSHPKEGDYCVFANETADKTNVDSLDFAYVESISYLGDDEYVFSKDLYSPVKLKYCWKIHMSVHD